MVANTTLLEISCRGSFGERSAEVDIVITCVLSFAVGNSSFQANTLCQNNVDYVASPSIRQCLNVVCLLGSNSAISPCV